MKKVYGVYDEDDGVIYTIYQTEEECGGLPHVELVENYTWEPSDFTDRETNTNYIAAERLADLFNALCQRTGMKKLTLAKMCGKGAVTWSRYCNGVTPVPRLIWEKVEQISKTCHTI